MVGIKSEKYTEVFSVNEQILKTVINQADVLSVNDFINYNSNIINNYKAVCFVRVLGVNNTILSDIQNMDNCLGEMTYNGRGVYIRISELPKALSFSETNYYSECYEEWINSNKTIVTVNSTLHNQAMQRILSIGCNEAVAVFEKIGSSANSSIIKNFVVKLMFWFDCLFNGAINSTDQNSTVKIVAENISKKHEYLFFYMLVKMGFNILLIQSKCDISGELENLNLSKKFTLGNFNDVLIPKYIPQKRCADFSASPAIPVVSCNNQASQNFTSTSPTTSDGKIVVKIPERNRSKSSNPNTNINNTVVNSAVPTSVPPMQNMQTSNGKIVMKIPERNRSKSSNLNTNRNNTVVNSAVPTSVPPVQSTRTPDGKIVMKIPERNRSNRSSNSFNMPYTSQPVHNSTNIQSSITQEKNYEELASLAKSVVMIGIYDKKGEMIASGSGIMISRKGYILTNNHVARSGCFYSVRIEDDEEIYTSYELIKYNQLLDLAVLRINRELNPIPVYKGNKDLVRGQKVVAIGSPLGLFNSVSDGIISGFRNIRDIEMIQFTAPISSGSSGGAVLNMYGEVIGISTAGIDEGQNINLAVGYKYINPFIQGFI